MIEKYERQRYNALYRGIPWEFTYETWLEWWKSTGKLAERGRKSHEYCMCRIGDSGPYSPDNVFCATNADNNRDAFKNGVKPFGGKCTNFAGKSHSEESRKRISENNFNNLSDEVIAYRISIYNEMDMTKWGALGRYAKAIGISHTRARKFIDKYLQDVSSVG